MRSPFKPLRRWAGHVPATAEPAAPGRRRTLRNVKMLFSSRARDFTAACRSGPTCRRFVTPATRRNPRWLRWELKPTAGPSAPVLTDTYKNRRRELVALIAPKMEHGREHREISREAGRETLSLTLRSLKPTQHRLRISILADRREGFCPQIILPSFIQSPAPGISPVSVSHYGVPDSPESCLTPPSHHHLPSGSK